MEVQISYTIQKKRIIHITPEEYCKLRADLSSSKYFPDGAYNRDIDIADDSELWDYWAKKREEKND